MACTLFKHVAICTIALLATSDLILAGKNDAKLNGLWAKSKRRCAQRLSQVQLDEIADLIEELLLKNASDERIRKTALDYCKENSIKVDRKCGRCLDCILEHSRVSIQPLQLPRSGLLTSVPSVRSFVPFRIVTRPGGGNCYLELVEWSERADEFVEPVASFFVRAGEAFVGEVPIGKYELRYALGETWRGYRHLFGNGLQEDPDPSNIAWSSEVGAGYTVHLFKLPKKEEHAAGFVVRTATHPSVAYPRMDSWIRASFRCRPLRSTFLRREAMATIL